LPGFCAEYLEERVGKLIVETPVVKPIAPSSLRKRCPDCGGLLLLEAVYGDGYWWSCLICGWQKPSEVTPTTRPESTERPLRGLKRLR
jgi:hypothetical protein